MHADVNRRDSGVGCQVTILTLKPVTWIYSVFSIATRPAPPVTGFFFMAATQCRRLGFPETRPGKRPQRN
jgi:hypothetical protein